MWGMMQSWPRETAVMMMRSAGASLDDQLRVPSEGGGGLAFSMSDDGVLADTHMRQA